MVYITGDTHGDLSRFESKLFKKLKKGDTLIICGDFGFIWEGSRKEEKELRKLAKLKYNICFVDGTHENFELLSAYPEEEWNGGKVHKIAHNIFHLKRGQVFTIESKTYFTMGGGVSPDLDYRLNTEKYSSNEMPSKEEMVEGADNLNATNLKVDVVVTHEPAAKVKSFLLLHDDVDTRLRVTPFNNYLEEIVAVVEYDKWYFGSLHLDKFVSSNNIAVFQNLLDAVTGERVR